MSGKSHRQKQPAYREVGRRVPPLGVPILFIWLRDVISIKSHAFNGDITKELYAPKASMIESMAFKECYSTEQSYWNTDDSKSKKFLGLTFMDIRESGY